MRTVLAWTLSGFCNWAPALIALDPTVMAYAEGVREKGGADVAPSTVSTPRRNASEPAYQTRIWVAKLEK